MSWAARRRILILFILALMGAVVASFYLYPYFFRTPTCFDGKKNGDEQGIDCGGTCQKICPRAEMDNVLVKYARFMPTRPGQYDLFAYVENQNPHAASKSLSYRFRLYDSKGVVIADRTGTTPVYANTVVPVFEPNLNTGNDKPARASFDFEEENPVWLFVESGEANTRISVLPPQYSSVTGVPKVTAMVENNTLYRIMKPSFVIVLYNENGTAYASSRTVLDKLSPGERANIFFSWPVNLPEPARMEILPVIDQFTLSKGI